MHRFLNHVVTVKDVLIVGGIGLIAFAVLAAIVTALSNINWDR